MRPRRGQPSEPRLASFVAGGRRHSPRLVNQGSALDGPYVYIQLWPPAPRGVMSLSQPYTNDRSVHTTATANTHARPY